MRSERAAKSAAISQITEPEVKAPKEEKTKAKSRGRQKSAAKPAPKQSRTKKPKTATKRPASKPRSASPAKKTAKQSSGKAKVTISGRKVINNVTHYRVKSGAGFDFKAIYELNADSVMAWEQKQFDSESVKVDDRAIEPVEHIVHKILDERIRYKNVVYKIRWKGFGHTEDSWLKLSDLGNAPEALAEWEAKKEKAAQKKAERAKARAEKAAAKKAERAAQPKKPKGKQAKKPANDKPAEKPAES